jgi:hypothetical protein
MAETICLVVANSVKDTGRVSFRFKALSGLPYEDCIAYPIYGLLRLEEKKPDEVNPWRLVRGNLEQSGQMVFKSGPFPFLTPAGNASLRVSMRIRCMSKVSSYFSSRICQTVRFSLRSKIWKRCNWCVNCPV